MMRHRNGGPESFNPVRSVLVGAAIQKGGMSINGGAGAVDGLWKRLIIIWVSIYGADIITLLLDCAAAG